MSETSEKFKDDGARVFDFSDEFLVECPNCQSLARVIVRQEKTSDVVPLYASRKLVCGKCGLSKFWHEREVLGYQMNKRLKSGFNRFVKIGGNFDWYFQQPLWLQTECCGETLWAYNEKHLEFIESYVAARLRERTPNINRSLASRLPKWIKRTKNRDEILKAIRKLKEKLNGKS